VWRGQLDDVCRRGGFEEGCLTVALGDVDPAEGLENVSDDLTQATDTTTTPPESVDVECFPVLIHPGNIKPDPEGTTGKTEVGTRFIVDVECRRADDTGTE
jgi:hypothetical protein